MKQRLLKRYSAVEGGFSYVTAVVAFLVMTLIYSAVMGGLEEGTAGYDVVGFLLNTLIQFCFLIAALQPARVLGSRHTYYFAKPRPRECLIAVGLTVVCVIGFDALAVAFTYVLKANGFAGGTIVSFDDPLGIVLSVFRIVLIAPVCEELLFRGSVLSSLGVTGNIPSRRRVSFMVVTCGLLFALIHMNPLQTVYQFMFGCALAYVTVRFANIIPAVIMHALNNAIGFVLSIPAIDGALAVWVTSVMESSYGIAIWLIVGAVLAVLAAFIIRFVGRKFGGHEPISPEPNETRPEEEKFHPSADDGGTLAGLILTSVGALICIVMWVTTLVAGFV